MYVDRESERKRQATQEVCVRASERGRPRRGGREMEGEKRMSWHRIFAYEPERARAALPLAPLTGG